MADKRPGMVTDASRVFYGKKFQKSVKDLKNPEIKGRILDKIMLFQSNPELSTFNLEDLMDYEGGKICSIRVSGGYRIIMQKRDDLHAYVLLKVDNHDGSYDWVNDRMVVDLNEEVMALQVYDVPEERPAAESGLFSPEKCSDRNLLRLGVPEEQISLVRSIRNEDDLMEQIEHFPEDVQERLMDLASGTPLSALFRGIEENKAATPGGDALRSPETLRSFTTFGLINPELKQILMEGSLEDWRVFLHPVQRGLIQERFDGPALVEGCAGTGKTITAIHRAQQLAARMIEEKVEGKILYTFYTSNLIEDNTNKLRSICTPAEFRRIEVQNIDKLPIQELKAAGNSPSIRMLGGNDLKPVWEEAVARADLEKSFPVDFYWREWDQIVTEQEEITLEEYLRVKRTGRRRPLYPAQREETWKVFEAYQAIMAEKDWIDNKMAMYRGRKLVEERQAQEGAAPAYRHIIVDETQDFSSGALRLVRALAGEPHPDDIFLVGDTRQRIYDRKPSLAGCGIDVKGRRSELYLNYRTTCQLQAAAMQLLKGESFEDLNGELGGRPRYISCTSGAEPQAAFFAGAEGEFQWILGNIQELVDGGVSPSDICLTTYRNDMVDKYLRLLRDSGQRPFRLASVDERGQEGVRVATMHRVKGLEFQYMFIAGINAGEFPRKGAAGERLKQDKCLMYVALTRAQKGAYVSGYGKTQSAFLKELMEKS